MNTAIKAAGNLELVYPGTQHIGHGGEVAPWPIEPGTGRNLTFYEQNNVGPYKSYHVVERHTDFFGAYQHDDEFGMGRYSTRDDKLGKKAWIWGLSRQGMTCRPRPSPACPSAPPAPPAPASAQSPYRSGFAAPSGADGHRTGVRTAKVPNAD